MHHIQKSFRARSYRRASFLFILAYLSIIATVAFTVYTFFKGSDNNLMILGALMGASLFFSVISMLASSSCRCQLCQTSNMRSLRCSRNRKAKKLAGSYRLRVSTSILFTGSFRCPYCGEGFSLSPRPIKNIEQAPPTRRATRTRPTQNMPIRRN